MKTPALAGLAPALLACLLCPASLAVSAATLHVIGDLPGGGFASQVRDAVRVGEVLHAVGSGTAVAGPGFDTGVYWSSTGGLVALPGLVANTTANNPVFASAITPDAAYIAARARAHPTGPLRYAVRVTTSGPTNLSLGNLGDFTQFSAANAISADGSIVYGFGINGSGQSQAVRYTVAGPTALAIPFLNEGDTTNTPAGRASSADGNVMVGTSTNPVVDGGDFHGPGNAAFRYVHGSGVSAIPFLSGGSWSAGLAVSPDGNLALGYSNSTAYPHGELFVHNATTTALTPLGSPAGGWRPSNFGGMSADGTVVAISFFPTAGPGGGTYIRNANGWFELDLVAAAKGAPFTGWTSFEVLGMSADGTLVWGDGSNESGAQGWILEFGAGELASYNADVVTHSITGTWRIASGDGPEHDTIVAFLPNGFGYLVEHPQEDSSGVDGFERFTYTWDPVSKAFSVTVLSDSNGDIGLSGLQGVPGLTITRLDNTFTLTIPGDEVVSASRVTGPSPIVGGWIVGNSAAANDSTFLAFLPDGTYFLAADNPPGDPSCPAGGIEYGGYEWNEGTGALDIAAFVDTNGECGLSHPQAGFTLQVNGDQFLIADGVDQASGTRVEAVTAALPPPKSDFNADGKSDLLFANTDGRAAIWLMDGVASTGSAEIIGAGTGWSVVQIADFDGDGKSDLAWQHTDGRMAIYLMDGTVPSATQQLLNAGSWSVTHTPDLDGDGRADLLFQNTDGTVAVWTMNGTSMTAGASIIGAGSGWSVIATGDFDADGKHDLVWRHTDGRHAIWLMDGVVVAATNQILNAGGWTATHTPDLNGDGRADIVWQHSDGTIALWLMNGAAMQSGAGLLAAGTGWSVTRAGDFSGDGKADLFFLHTDGRAAIYLMDGLAPTATQQILNAGGGWSARRLQDLNGDGKADIVWANTDGSTAVWLMDGTTMTSGAGLIGTGTGWSANGVSP